MNDSEQMKLFIDISKNLGEINQSLKSVCESLKQHDKRLQDLEMHADKSNDNFKTELLKLLAKGLLISLVVIGSLTGASALIQKTLGL